MRKVLKVGLLLLLLGVANIVHFLSDFVMICHCFVLFRRSIHSKNGKHISIWTANFSSINLSNFIVYCPIDLFLVVLVCFCLYMVVNGLK